MIVRRIRCVFGSLLFATLIGWTPEGLSQPAANPPIPLSSGGAAREALARRALHQDFSGDHAGAERSVSELRSLYPEDPMAALIEVEHRFWPQLYDYGDVRDSPRLVAAIEEAVRLASDRHARDPEDLEGRSLYGRALMHDARRLAFDGYYMRAGTQSERARKVLEAVVAERPDDGEARYLLGNYYYWASVLPSFLKAVNWLWFVPKGDRLKGIEYLQWVSSHDGLYSDSAKVMLTVIDSHHSPPDLEAALGRVVPLAERFPSNALIQVELIGVLFKLERYDEVLAMLEGLAARVDEPQPVRAYALTTGLWRARVALHRGRADEAWGQLDELETRESELPNWTPAWIDLLRAQILDARGEREAALGYYDQVLSYEGIMQSKRATRLAIAGREKPFERENYEPVYLDTGSP